MGFRFVRTSSFVVDPALRNEKSRSRCAPEMSFVSVDTRTGTPGPRNTHEEQTTREAADSKLRVIFIGSSKRRNCAPRGGVLTSATPSMTRSLSRTLRAWRPDHFVPQPTPQSD